MEDRCGTLGHNAFAGCITSRKTPDVGLTTHALEENNDSVCDRFFKKGWLSFAPGLDFVIEVFSHKIVLGYLEIEVAI